MYIKHHTEGLIIKSYPQGEANKRFMVLTKDFGLIYAKAQSVREMRSKNRQTLQDMSFVELSMVKGKNEWKIISSSMSKNFFEEFRLSDAKMSVFVNVIALIRRMIKGEEQNKNLYSIVKTGFSYLARDDIREDDMRNIEILIVMRILNSLGYLKHKEEFVGLIEADKISPQNLDAIEKIKTDAIKEINYSLEASQL